MIAGNSARGNAQTVTGRSTMVDKPSAGGQKRLKKNIIKQRAGKNTQVNPMFTRKGQTSGFTST